MSRDPSDEARSSVCQPKNLKMEGSGLLQWAPKQWAFFGFIRLQIDSTDRCEYSATSVDVFTHNFMH